MLNVERVVPIDANRIRCDHVVLSEDSGQRIKSNLDCDFIEL